jgi:hypothetical protein
MKAARHGVVPLVAILSSSLGMGAARAFGDTRNVIKWSEPVEIAHGPAVKGEWRQNESNYQYLDDPSVALFADGTGALVWVDQREKDVLFQPFAANGDPAADARLNVSRSPETFSWLPRVLIVKSTGDIHVLWQEIIFSGGSHGGEIMIASSRDRGRTFSTPLNLSESVPGDGKGRINEQSWQNGSLDLAEGRNGDLYAAWTEYDGPLWFRRSVDQAKTFTTRVQLNRNQQLPARGPSIAVTANGHVLVFWATGEDPRGDLWLARSRDGGVTFSEPVRAIESSGYSDAPRALVDRAGHIHLFWAESRGGYFDPADIYHAVSRDSGGTFDPLRRVSPPQSQGAGYPEAVLTASGDIAVTWAIMTRQLRHRALGFALLHAGGDVRTAPWVIPEIKTSEAREVYGSLQGLFMKRLAAAPNGDVVLVYSTFLEGERSAILMARGRRPNERKAP